MTRFIRTTIVSLVLLAPLGGCASLIESAVGAPQGVLTASVQNPVTKETLFRVENGLRVAVVGLQTYKNYCEQRPVGDQCDAVVARLQTYSRRARPLVRQLRIFVRKNDQVNAKVVFSTLRGLFGEFQNYAAANGVVVPSIGVQ